MADTIDHSNSRDLSLLARQDKMLEISGNQQDTTSQDSFVLALLAAVASKIRPMRLSLAPVT